MPRFFSWSRPSAWMEKVLALTPGPCEGRLSLISNVSSTSKRNWIYKEDNPSTCWTWLAPQVKTSAPLTHQLTETYQNLSFRFNWSILASSVTQEFELYSSQLIISKFLMREITGICATPRHSRLECFCEGRKSTPWGQDVIFGKQGNFMRKIGHLDASCIQTRPFVAL